MPVLSVPTDSIVWCSPRNMPQKATKPELGHVYTRRLSLVGLVSLGRMLCGHPSSIVEARASSGNNWNYHESHQTLTLYNVIIWYCIRLDNNPHSLGEVMHFFSTSLLSFTVYATLRLCVCATNTGTGSMASWQSKGGTLVWYGSPLHACPPVSSISGINHVTSTRRPAISVRRLDIE